MELIKNDQLTDYDILNLWELIKSKNLGLFYKRYYWLLNKTDLEINDLYNIMNFTFFNIMKKQKYIDLCNFNYHQFDCYIMKKLLYSCLNQVRSYIKSSKINFLSYDSINENLININKKIASTCNIKKFVENEQANHELEKIKKIILNNFIDNKLAIKLIKILNYKAIGYKWKEISEIAKIPVEDIYKHFRKIKNLYYKK